MENLFQHAKDAVNRFTSSAQDGDMNEQDKQAAQNAIQSAYEGASAEEKQQLQQLEEQLEQSQLS